MKRCVPVSQSILHNAYHYKAIYCRPEVVKFLFSIFKSLIYDFKTNIIIVWLLILI